MKVYFIQSTPYDSNMRPIKKSRLHFVGLAPAVLAALASGLEFEICLETIEDVDFDGNPIADFTPLRGHPSITTLSLSNCGITDISFLAQMPSLYDISLEGNKIKDFSPLKEILSLKHINAGGNGLSADEIAKWNNEFRHIEEFHFYID